MCVFVCLCVCVWSSVYVCVSACNLFPLSAGTVSASATSVQHRAYTAELSASSAPRSTGVVQSNTHTHTPHALTHTHTHTFVFTALLDVTSVYSINMTYIVCLSVQEDGSLLCFSSWVHSFYLGSLNLSELTIGLCRGLSLLRRICGL